MTKEELIKKIGLIYLPTKKVWVLETIIHDPEIDANLTAKQLRDLLIARLKMEIVNLEYMNITGDAAHVER